VMEALDVGDTDALMSSEVCDMHNIGWVFRLAAMLNDGNISKTAEDHTHKEAQPKNG